MSLEDQIKDTLVPDTDTVLEKHIDTVKDFLEIFEDGTIVIKNEYRNVDSSTRILIYLIGRRYAYEANLSESDTLATEFFYGRFDASDRTVRNWLQGLRDAGLVAKEGRSEHRIVVENLSDAVERVQNEKE